MAEDFEDVSVFVLSSERELTLLEKQTECVFMWATSEGDAVGVIMNFVFHDGKFWLTGSGQRKRFAALARRRSMRSNQCRGRHSLVAQEVVGGFDCGCAAEGLRKT